MLFFWPAVPLCFRSISLLFFKREQINCFLKTQMCWNIDCILSLSPFEYYFYLRKEKVQTGKWMRFHRHSAETPPDFLCAHVTSLWRVQTARPLVLFIRVCLLYGLLIWTILYLCLARSVFSTQSPNQSLILNVSRCLCTGSELMADLRGSIRKNKCFNDATISHLLYLF